MARNLLSFLLVAAIGFVNAGDPEKLVGAQDAYPGQFPYTVSLRIDNSHVCGGAIISDYFVITAAHCVKALNKYLDLVTVVTGSIYLDQGGEIHNVDSLIAHPEYASNSIADFDVGVIKLENPIAFNDLQQAIPLPTASPSPNNYAVVSAWGSTAAPPEGNLSNTMQYLYLRMINLNVCQQFKNLGVQGNVICTYDGVGIGLCPGDSGSPLVYNGQLIGVVSRGIPCARGEPDIFTNVYDNIDFVRDVMENY